MRLAVFLMSWLMVATLVPAQIANAEGTTTCRETTSSKGLGRQVQGSYTSCTKRDANKTTKKATGSPSPRPAPPKPKPPTRMELYKQCVASTKRKIASVDIALVPILCASRYLTLDKKEAEKAARELLVKLRLPDTNPQFGPNPANNEWNMLAVGYPIWLYVGGPLTKSTSVSANGMTFRLRATRTGTTFTMGDGGSVTCATTTPYPTGVTPGTPSPTCGYTYRKASLPHGKYTVTATAHWRINWSVSGSSGRFNHSYSDTSQLAVGELQALVR